MRRTTTFWASGDRPPAGRPLRGRGLGCARVRWVVLVGSSSSSKKDKFRVLLGAAHRGHTPYGSFQHDTGVGGNDVRVPNRTLMEATEELHTAELVLDRYRLGRRL